MLSKALITIAIICLAILSCSPTMQNFSWDITQNQAHTLTTASKKLLDTLDSDVTLTVYSPSMRTLNICAAFITPYVKYSAKIHATYQQTTLPVQGQKNLQIFTDHVLLVTYKNIQRAIDIRLGEFTEAQISSLIQQTVNAENHWVVFVTGHLEADPLDATELGLSQFTQMLTKQGLHVTELNMAKHQAIPQNTSLLIIVNPQQTFLPIENELLHEYLQHGGKLLWFTEPGSKDNLLLAEEFGLKLANGVAIDPTSKHLGSPHPAVKIINHYPTHLITSNLTGGTILPWSGHLQMLYQVNDWEQTPFLTTGDATWTYSGPQTDDLTQFALHKAINGPLNLGIALERKHGTATQRALVLADSSFITNKYLSLYANAQLAANVLEWVQQDVQIFVFNQAPLRDLSYNPSKLDLFMYKYFFTLILPMMLLAFGFRHKIYTLVIWRIK